MTKKKIQTALSLGMVDRSLNMIRDRPAKFLHKVLQPRKETFLNSALDYCNANPVIYKGKRLAEMLQKNDNQVIFRNFIYTIAQHGFEFGDIHDGLFYIYSRDGAKLECDIGYKGFKTIAARYAIVIKSGIEYEGDDFVCGEYWDDGKQRDAFEFRHYPSGGGKIKRVYARFINNNPDLPNVPKYGYEIFSFPEVLKRKPSYHSAFWEKEPRQAYMKTVVRTLLNQQLSFLKDISRLVQSITMMEANAGVFEFDEDAEDLSTAYTPPPQVVNKVSDAEYANELEDEIVEPEQADQDIPDDVAVKIEAEAKKRAEDDT